MFVPLDVSAEVLTEAAQVIAADYPSVTVEPVVADFNEPFAELPGTPGERLIIFLGGTIGNFDDDERDRVPRAHRATRSLRAITSCSAPTSSSRRRG